MTPATSRYDSQKGTTDSDDKFTLGYDDSPSEDMYHNSRLRREIGQYLEEVEDQGLTRKYVQQHKVTLMAFLDHCIENDVTMAKAVTAEVVQGFVEKYQDCSATYQRHTICVVRKFLLTNGNPVMLTMKLQVRGYSRKRVDWLTPEETEKVFQTLMSPQEAFIVGSGFLQGMRKVEILRMTAKDARMALSSGVLRIRGKDHKLREIPVHEDYAQILSAYLRVLDPKSDDERLLPYCPSWAEKLLDRFCERFGRRFTFHTMRRTCGRNLWLLADEDGRRTVPIETISEYLGHNSTEMTRRYLGINLTDMRQALSCYNVARSCTFVKSLVNPVG